MNISVDFRKARKVCLIFSCIFILVLLAVCVFFMYLASNINSVPDGYVKTTATIVSVGNPDFDIPTEVTYEVDGQVITSQITNMYESTWHTGGTMTIYYNPQSPTEIVADSSFAKILFIAAPLIFVVVSVIILVVNIKRLKAINQSMKDDKKYDTTYGDTNSTNSFTNQIDNQCHFETGKNVCDVEFDHFTFTYQEKPSKGFYIKDKNGEIVYKLTVKKRGVFKASQYEFTNVLTGYTKTHAITNPITITTNYDFPRTTFKIDGEKQKEYLANRGIKIELVSLNNFCPVYKVFYGGTQIAGIQTNFSLRSILRDTALFNIDTEDSYLDYLAIACYVIMNNGIDLG